MERRRQPELCGEAVSLARSVAPSTWEGGYDAFTIAAVCERAQVAPRTIHDRTPSKEPPFRAVSEHGLLLGTALSDLHCRHPLPGSTPSVLRPCPLQPTWVSGDIRRPGKRRAVQDGSPAAY
nr:helix-turn-helix domain-containing protein [Streptomyces sp. SAI-144]